MVTVVCETHNALDFFLEKDLFLEIILPKITNWKKKEFQQLQHQQQLRTKQKEQKEQKEKQKELQEDLQEDLQEVPQQRQPITVSDTLFGNVKFLPKDINKERQDKHKQRLSTTDSLQEDLEIPDNLPDHNSDIG
ncbi:8983_t:CDS:2 [Entrophospora sp. SA101]|nr:5380_t:CDS:2 [Entrophospora sp. SA101]CAJ0825954.1 8983_t:CDS:2 [Entrophospora sp. SA101]